MKRDVEEMKSKTQKIQNEQKKFEEDGENISLAMKRIGLLGDKVNSIDLKIEKITEGQSQEEKKVKNHAVEKAPVDQMI